MADVPKSVKRKVRAKARTNRFELATRSLARLIRHPAVLMVGGVLVREAVRVIMDRRLR